MPCSMPKQRRKFGKCKQFSAPKLNNNITTTSSAAKATPLMYMLV